MQSVWTGQGAGSERDFQTPAYRAALMSVFAHSHPGGAELSRLFPASMRPMPIREALRLISSLPDARKDRALRIAVNRLAVSAAQTPDPELRRELRGYCRMLLGEELEGDIWKRLELGPRRARHAPVSTPAAPCSPHASSTGVSESLVARVHHLARERQSGERPSRQELEEACDALETLRPSSNLDVDSLVTSVTVTASSRLGFDRVAWICDPRTWSLQSPFWAASSQVERVNGRFQPVEGPPLGSPWKGLLYEFCEWNWNSASVIAVQNYLNIDYRWSRWTTSEGDELGLFWMGYSLHSCQGSMILTRLAPGGVDVDHGSLAVLYVHPREGQPRSGVLAQKCLRFSDILSRRTSQQGLPGAGQGLSYITPAAVGLWLYEGVYVSLLDDAPGLAGERDEAR
jgi:hypothetical protein